MNSLKEFKMNEIKELLISYATPINLLKTAAALGVSLFTYHTLVVYFRRREYRHIPGPCARNLRDFYLGCINDLESYLKNGKVFPELLSDYHKKYGDTYKFQILDHMFISTMDRDTIKELLIVKDSPKHERSSRLLGYPFNERFLGIGLLTDMNYERWKARRAIFNHGFYRQVLLTFVEHFNSIVNNLMEKFRKYADGKEPVSLFNEINRATLDAIALIAFGMNVDAINQKDSKLNTYLAKILHLTNETFIDPLIYYKPWNFKEIREFRHMVKYLRNVGREKILERINAFKNNEHLPNDILTSILTSYKDDNLDLEAMVDDFATFFLAGQETTANALAFCFLELGKHPKIIEKARQEIDRVIGERSEITYQDVNELKYCSAIFKETLRLFPPVPSLVRVTKNKMTIDGYEVPPNTKVFLSTYVNARNEKYFPNPLEFRPERFLKTADSNPDNIENYVYHPFSLGPRNCIGQNFAQIEGVIVIAKFLQKFDYRLDPTQSFAIEQNLTLRPKDGTRVFLQIRS